MSVKRLFFLFVLALFPLHSACSSATVNAPPEIENPGNGGAGPGSGGVMMLPDANIQLPPPVSVEEMNKRAAPPHCGDGKLDDDEACDDGNILTGDGCIGNCLMVERGYSCYPPGQPCHLVARCGDGLIIAPELCDDGNKNPGDGCSASCKIELGFKCSGNPSTCTTTTCGDGKVEGAESCDDKNTMPFDGCSTVCQNEPNCESGACTSRCGDGIKLTEDCDDGNNVSGDGCSAECKIEKGFVCTIPALGEKMMVPAIFRDFRYKNPVDFQPGATGRFEAWPGMVEKELDKEGKPVFTGLAGSLVASKESFAKWYRNVPGVNSVTSGQLALWNNGKGAFVNRYGPNGEQWLKTEIAHYCGNVGGEILTLDPNDPDAAIPIPCTSMTASETECTKRLALGMELYKCYVENNSYKALFILERVDGTPLFFPVDNDTFTPQTEREFAQIAPPIYDGTKSWPWEDGKPKHNFSFTSEVRYWFLYDSSKSYTLDFTGDDDVWVFVNKKLAVDLGGIHTPVNGSVTLNAANASKFGLTNGKVYEVTVFQAERQVSGSSYRLTLSGFTSAPSDCNPVCGDGVVGLGEECDDGVNTGGYGKCSPGCKYGAYCGDGNKDPGEDCDDGINDGTNGQKCPTGCRIIIIP
jgi:fibro-slime domain-containing protein